MSKIPMINSQPIEKREVRDDGSLEVVEVFSTIQGEGPFAGTPAIFVRLAACNLMCNLCDTDYTTGRRVMTINQLLVKIDSLRSDGLVVVTGGEPFRQGCGPLTRALLDVGYHVQFETNGTLYDETMSGTYADVTIVCSPKTGSIHHDLVPVIDALKYILDADHKSEVDGLPTSSLNFGVAPCRPWSGFHGDVYVQPCDSGDKEQDQRNLEACLESCMKFGYKLCLQLHKILGLP